MGWRDKYGWYKDGFEFSVCDDRALQCFDELMFVFFNGKIFSPHIRKDYIKPLDELTNSYPDFVMGKLIKMLIFGDKSLIEEIKIGLDKKIYTEYEEAHCKAFIAFLQHETEQASEIWTEHLIICPKDLIALRMGFFCHFFLGNIPMILSIISRSLPHFKKEDACYGYLLNFLAFGFEENNFLELADKTITEGLSLVPDDGMGIHVQAHIHESQCKYEEGIKFLEETEDAWKDQFLGCHTYWHLCLFHVEMGNYSKALEIFDEKMVPKILYEKSYLCTNDGVQLLYRLEFNDVSVGERWDYIYKGSSNLSLNHFSAFYLVHVVLSQLREKSSGKSNGHLEIIEPLEKNLPVMQTHTSNVVKNIVIPIIQAFIEYQKKNYESSVEIMYSMKEKLCELGASHSQLDFFVLFLLDACTRTKKESKKRIMGKQLLNERKFLKEYSPMSERIAEKM